MPRPVLPLLVLTSLLWCPAAAAAVDEEALIKHGLELRQAQQDEAALREFRRAWELARTGRALAQVALAEQALGRWLDAEEHLTSALKRATEEWIARNRALLEHALHDIEGHLGWVELTGEMPAGSVSINGKHVATLPAREPLRAPAGSIAVEAQAEGYLPIVRMVVVPARGLAREPLVFVPVAKPLPAVPEAVASDVQTTPAAPPAPARTWRPRDTAGVVFGAAALGSLATGIAFHVIREDRAGTYQDLGCEALPDSTRLGDCRSRHDGIKTATYLSIAGYAGTAVFSAVAAYLLFGGERGASKPATAGGVLPSCGVGYGPGVVCAGRF